MALVLLLTGGRAVAAPVYERVAAELQAHANRLPGGEGFRRAVAAVSNELTAAGIPVRLQTYDTLVPRTELCRLTVGGRELREAYPLNNGLAPLNMAAPLAGDAVWAGNGSLAALDGIELRDRVAVLDFDAPLLRLDHVFMLGARAALLVGAGRASQWSLASLCEEGPVSLPTVYLPRPAAENAGLPLRPDAAPAPVELQVRARLIDVTTANLWALLPGTADTVFRLDAPETLVLSATLNTAGVVPDLCPESRMAANAALLTDIAVRLAGKPRSRDLLVVFFGSSYAAQEGARMFYHVADKAMLKPGDRGSLAESAESLRAEQRRVDELLAAAARPALLADRGEAAATLHTRLRQRLAGLVNNINARLAELRLAESSPATGAETRAALAAEAEELVRQKHAYNTIRQCINQRSAEYGDAAWAYAENIGALTATLETRRDELRRMADHTASFEQLAAVLRGRVLVAHLDLDFARADAPWMFSMIGAHELYSPGIDPGAYLMHLARLGEQWTTTGAGSLFAPALNPFYKPFALSVPSQRSTPVTAGILLGVPGLSLMTVGDRLDRDATPTPSVTQLAPLAEPLTDYFARLATAPEMSLRRPFMQTKAEDRLVYAYRGGDEYNGVQFVTTSRGSADIEGTAQNAVAVYAPGTALPRIAGLSRHAAVRINADGYTFMPGISRNQAAAASTIMAYGYTPGGAIDRYSRAGSSLKTTRIGLFYGHGGGAFSYGFAPDPLGSEIYQARTLDARTDAAPKTSYSGGLSAIQAFFSDRRGAIKRIGSKGELLLGASAERPMGTGVPLEPDALLRLNGIRQGAWDYWFLNESRLEVLRQRNIVSDALEKLHADAREHLDRAAERAREARHTAARAHEIAATSLENRVYGPLRGITDDLVQAVVVLLLLNIPFAFAMERLLCGFTHIFKQVLGFVGFFVGTFLVLFFTHPAFSLASAPIVIFLAFVIILLGVVTLYIVLGKIKHEIRAIQGLASTVHGVASESSTAGAAILIGIAGMRNRPLKTFLTAVTVVLLTFTILVFASFTAELGVVETYLGKGQDEDRIELHRFSYLDIPPAQQEALQALYGDRYDLFRRGGLFMNPTRKVDQGTTPLTADRVLYNPASGEVAGIGAVLGIEPGEARRSARLARVAPGLAATTPEALPPLYLPAETALRLKAAIGDTLLLNGYEFHYAGELGKSAMQGMLTIDGTRIVPPDFAATLKNIGKKTESGAGDQELEQVDSGSFAWFSPEQVAITDYGVLEQRYRGTYAHFLVLYPKQAGTDLERTARELAPLFHGAVHVKSGEGARRMYFTKAVEGSGFGDVIVPLLLGGLIIFSSLMGSIVDREREIFTYSALGLSPPSVGALFFAESAVYSVVGGMGGYLLGQVVAKLLNFMGSRGWIQPPEMNFASLTSVLTILIVMAVVMLSTIYPALKAGKSANPGVARKWKMPAPKGSRLDFIFPFTVSETDFTGILSFIREHFENHSDATLGNFAARDVHLFSRDLPSGRRSLGIRAEISLAPFDLGIFQKFRLYSQEFEIKGIDEVVVELERIGGTPQAWLRSNRMFADELRRQFLLWRSLPVATIEHYRRQTEAELGTGRGTP